MSSPDTDSKLKSESDLETRSLADERQRKPSRPPHLSVVSAPDQGAGSLFRREMVDHQRRRLQGEVLIGAGPTWIALGYSMIAILVVGLVFISLLTYARTETVTGWLVPKGGIVRLTADLGGAVDSVYVSEGEILPAGRPVVRLRLSRQTTGGDTGQLMEKAGVAQLEATRASSLVTIAKIRADREALVRQLAVLAEQERQAHDLLTILEEKQALGKAKVKRSEELKAQGFLSAQSLDDINSAYLDTSQAVANQRNALLVLSQSRSDLEARLAQIPIQLDEATANANGSEAAMVRQLEQTRAGDAYTVNSPADSVVMALPVIQGQNLMQGSTVALLQPANTALEAEIYVPSRAAGFIQVGQEVSLQYQPFPYKKFGSAKGRIISVSRAPLTPAEVALSGFTVGEPVFRVRARLDKPYVTAYGIKTNLQAGTALTAMIVVDRRTLIEWLFDPLFAVARR